jgi:MATE family multidrug resistance protein
VKTYREILRLVWPIALGMMNGAIMQFVDRAYLARHSMTALEAVLPATTLAWIFMSFFQSVVGYSGVFVAQYHGAGDAAAAARSYRAGLLLAALSGVVMLPLVPLGNWIFSLTAASPAVLADEKAYYGILLLGGFFVFGQMAAASYFTGHGRTRVVFWVSLAGNLLNIAIDPLLIFGGWGIPAFGISGAAAATVVSLALQFAVLAALAHRDRPACGTGRVAASGALLLKILRFGIPAGAYEVVNMASFTIFVFVTGRVGDVAFAASNACFTLNYLLYAPVTGFAIGAQTLVGQACGRGDAAGARRVLRRTLHLALGFIALSCLLVLLFHRPLLELFAPADPALRREFLTIGFRLLLLMGAWMLFDGTDTIVSGALKGAGDTKFVMFWMFVASFVFWLPLVFAVAGRHGTMPALWATMVAYVLVICTGTLIRWRRGRWASIALVSSPAGEAPPA